MSAFRIAGHRRFLLTACVAAIALSLVIGGGSCQHASAPGADAVREGTIEFDAGPLLVSADGPPRLEHEFELINPSSSESLRPALVQRSCGCTSVQFDPEVIPPSGTGRVRVSVELVNRTERRNVVVEVATGLSSEPPRKFQVGWEAYSRLTLEPAEGLRLGGEAGDASLKILTIVAHQRIDEPEQRFAVEFRHGKREFPTQVLDYQTAAVCGGRYRRVTALCAIAAALPDAAHCARGNEPAVLSVRFGEQVLRRDVVLDSRLPIEATPSRVLLCVDGRDSSPPQRTVTLQARSPFRILAVKSSIPNLVCQPDSDEPAILHQLSIRVPRMDDESPRLAEGMIEVETDLADQPRVAIQAYVMQRPAK
jgi:hypothetical protein